MTGVQTCALPISTIMSTGQTFPVTNGCRFSPDWYKHFDRIEYSESKNKVFCFPCSMFANIEASDNGYKFGGTDGDAWFNPEKGVSCNKKTLD